jgi:hypothetical protein
MLEPSRTGNSSLPARLLPAANQSLVFVVFLRLQRHPRPVPQSGTARFASQPAREERKIRSSGAFFFVGSSRRTGGPRLYVAQL